MVSARDRPGNVSWLLRFQIFVDDTDFSTPAVVEDASQAAMGRGGDYRAPESRWFPPPNLQPHAYVLSPSGHPIPVYSTAHAATGRSSFDFSHGPAVSATPTRAGATLPIHAQPLRFEHALPYAAGTDLTRETVSIGTVMSGPFECFSTVEPAGPSQN